MKKIRLSERELTNIIKKVIKEGVFITIPIEGEHDGVKYTIQFPDGSGNPGTLTYGEETYTLTEVK
jgi:hypothetical protein